VLQNVTEMLRKIRLAQKMANRTASFCQWHVQFLLGYSPRIMSKRDSSAKTSKLFCGNLRIRDSSETQQETALDYSNSRKRITNGKSKLVQVELKTKHGSSRRKKNQMHTNETVLDAKQDNPNRNAHHSQPKIADRKNRIWT
jgi:hypothetical protein